MSDIVFTDSGSANAEYRLRLTGGNLELLRNGVVVDSQLFAIVNSVTINGGTGDDTLLIDQLITLPGGVSFNGGLPVGLPGDLITITAAADSVAYSYRNATDGQIVFTAGGTTSVYDFTGIDPVDMTGTTVGNLVFNTPGGLSSQIVLEINGSFYQIRSLNGTFETTAFALPTGSLTINGQPTDTLAIDIAALGFGSTNATLSAGAISTASGIMTTGTVVLKALAGAITFNTGAIIAGTLDLSSTAGISQSAGMTLTAGTLQSTLGVTSDVDLTNTSNAVTMLSNFSVTSGHFRLVDNVGSLTIDGTVSATDVQISNIFGAVLIGSATFDTSTLDLIAGGTVVQAGAFNIGAGSGTLNLEVALGDVILTNVNNAFAHLGSADLVNGRLTLVDALALSIDGAVFADAVVLAAASLATSVGGIITTAGGLTLVSDGNGTFSGVISGGALTKGGAGTITLAATNTYSGATTIDGGTLLVDGSIVNSATEVGNGATLGGHGTAGAVTVQSGGTLAPGDSPGTLSTHDLTLMSGANFDVQIGGTSSGQFDQVAVTGTVDLTGAILHTSLVNGFGPGATLGTELKIINNDGSDAVTGHFAGLGEGGRIMLGGALFELSYHGGDGNDVTLTVLGLAPTDVALSQAIVPEHSANGTVVGTLSDTDPDPADTATYSLVDDAGGRFAINGNALVVANGALLDFASNRTQSVTVQVTDAGGLAFQKTFTITVAAQGTPGNDSYTAPAAASALDAVGGVDTISFGFKLTDATVTYQDNQIIIDGPNGSHTVTRGFEVFVFTDGTVNNADGNPLVDDLYYYSHNHDVWNAHADADLHYAVYGWKEGRDPDAFFSTSGYLAANPDVAAVGVNPLAHYDQFGWKEGRNPAADFDTDAYLAANPDVAAAQIDPLAHFLQYGAQEGRHAILVA